MSVNPVNIYIKTNLVSGLGAEVRLISQIAPKTSQLSFNFLSRWHLENKTFAVAWPWALARLNRFCIPRDVPMHLVFFFFWCSGEPGNSRLGPVTLPPSSFPSVYFALNTCCLPACKLEGTTQERSPVYVGMEHRENNCRKEKGFLCSLCISVLPQSFRNFLNSCMQQAVSAKWGL